MSLLAVSLVACRNGTRTRSEAPDASVAVSPAPVTAWGWQDVTVAAGLDSTYRNGREAGENAILESLGGGAGLLDFDRDGRLDVLLPTGGEIADRQITGLPNNLFRQWAPWRFAQVADAARVNQVGHYTHGCAIADVDNDGFADLLVTGFGGLQYYRNLGDGTFQESSAAARLNDEQWSSSAAWGDFNRDGAVDLYVTHYVDWSWENHPECTVDSPNTLDICSPHQFTGLQDTIYMSLGDGTFSEHSGDVGLQPEGKGLGVLAADVDLDLDLDLYIANDTVNNFLYLNSGSGTFEEQGLIAGVATDADGIPNGSMGLAVLDYRNDLLPDLWVTNYENETFGLYQNGGGGNFRSVSELSGVTALGTLYVGFGTVATDYDLDGDEDLIVSNGHVINHPRSGTPRQRPLVLENQGPRFERTSFPPDSYFSREHLGRSVVVGDFGDDGWPDLIFTHTNEAASLLRNAPESAGNWLRLNLIGRETNRDAIGAHAIAETTAGKMLRCVVGGGGYLSQNPYSLHWGLPAEHRIERVLIRWPSGQEQWFPIEEMNREYMVVEERARPASRDD